jgi:hypothetical protein
MIDKRHGGLWDRGSADAYYRREPKPHYFTGPTYASEAITDLTHAEVTIYMDAYRAQQETGQFKDCG